MKRILLANNLLQGGGVEKLMRDFALSFKEQYEITILTEYEDKDFNLLYPPDIKYLHYHPENVLGTVRGLRRLNKLIRLIHRKMIFCYLGMKSYDIAIAMKEGTISKYISNMRARERLSWVHVDYSKNYWTKEVFGSRFKEMNCMKSFRYIICVSERIRSSILHAIGNPGNLIVRYNPIDADRIRSLATEEADCNNLSVTDKPLFVAIGRLHPQKGFDLLLKGCSLLERDGLAYELWIIGSGSEEQTLKDIIASKELKQVKLLGERKNPYAYLKQATWFISSSRYEGYALACQEAAVLGIPIIATDCSGVRELLGDDGEYGSIVNIDAVSLYHAMKKVILNPDLHGYYQEQIKKRSVNINYEDRMKEIKQLFG